MKAGFSEGGGVSWGTPVAVDEGRPTGRVDVALLPHGPARQGVERSGAAALVSWLEDADQGAEALVVWRDASEPPRLRAAVPEVHE